MGDVGGTKHGRPVIEVCELGPLGIRQGDSWTSATGERTSVLIAALSLAGPHGVTSVQLIEAMWPSPDQPATARQSLANIVSRLRKAHGNDFIESTRVGYRFGAKVESDRHRFEVEVNSAAEAGEHKPREALALVDQALRRWRDEPWAGLERPDNVQADRAHLHGVRTIALRVRAAALVALNRREHALSDLRAVLAADPYDESSRRHLVRILADSGQRAEALGEIQEAHRLFAGRGLLLDAALADIEHGLLHETFRSGADVKPLPTQHTEFVGREAEAAAIRRALHSHRLVTLHGTGGAGKTRLAVEIASADGGGAAGFVALAEVRATSQVELAFARGLGLPANRLDGLEPAQRRNALADAASAATGILVIDNCEHVVDEVRDIVAGLVARPGKLRLLATSRVPLELAGEHRYLLPLFDHGPDLFVRRARDHGISLDLDREAEMVGAICEHVDHLPLAIEITAAQTPYRTLPELADDVERGVVHRDPRHSDPRHETMANAIRWSHELLEPETADALVRLGIFDGSFQQIDAAAVIQTQDSRRVLDTLVRCSLVERRDDGGRSAYRLPVPVQQFSAAELEARGGTTEVALALAEWLLEFTDRPYGDVFWRFPVAEEINDRWADALTGVAALRAAGRTDDATRLAGRLGGAGHLFGHADELVELLSDLWPSCDDGEATADALLAQLLCADIARRPELSIAATGMLGSMEGPAGHRHRVFVHCFHALFLMFGARLTGDGFGPAHEELEKARALEDLLESPINRAQLERWQSALHLLEGDWPKAEAAARRSLNSPVDMWFDSDATSCLCHALLQLGEPDRALQIALSHPDRGRDTTFGDRLGIAIAIARIQRGDIDTGLAEISEIQRRVRRVPWAGQQDDITVAIGYIAHLLGQDDLVREVLETGIMGFGPWLGFLITKMCRDMGTPDSALLSDVDLDPRLRSEFYGTVASHVLDELVARRPELKVAVQH